jgi:hypothetical protein
MENTNNSPLQNSQGKDKQKRKKKIIELLFIKILSRRELATELGYPDMSFMVTQDVLELIESGMVQVVGKIKCSRSTEFVQGLTSNPELFIADNTNQLNLFK